MTSFWGEDRSFQKVKMLAVKISGFSFNIRLFHMLSDSQQSSCLILHRFYSLQFFINSSEYKNCPFYSISILFYLHVLGGTLSIVIFDLQIVPQVI